MIKPQETALAGASGNRLASDVWNGGGAPVIFLHGGGQTRRAWDKTARRVAEMGLTAVTIDQRGHGESDWLTDQAYAIDDYASDVLAVARQVRERFGQRPAVIGASLGGIAALRADALGGRDVMRALVLVDITPRMERSGVDKIQGFMGERMHEGFATLEEAADAIARYLPHRKRPTSLAGLSKNLRQGADGRYRWHWDPGFLDGPRPINTGGEAVIERLTEAARGLDIPTLLVRGGQSELVSEEHVREFLELVPHADYVDVSGAGHMVAGDRNDAFADAVLDFLGTLRVS